MLAVRHPTRAHGHRGGVAIRAAPRHLHARPTQRLSRSAAAVAASSQPSKKLRATHHHHHHHHHEQQQQQPSVHAPAAAVAATAAATASLLLVLAGAPAADAGVVFEGPARIVDGDTLYIGKDKVRLFGIDAPEKGQLCSDARGKPYECGVASLEALKQRVGSKAVRCEVKNKDQYQRNVASCSIVPPTPFQQPEDIGTFLVRLYAVAYRAYGKEYVPLEDLAHSAHKGIWAGSFTEPALWRKQQKAATLNASLAAAAASSQQQQGLLPPPPPAAAVPTTGSRPSYAAVAAGGAAVGASSSSSSSTSSSSSSGQPQAQPIALLPASPPAAPGCSGPLIKGNINSKGQRIYHVSGRSGQYPRVEIDESRGERYFCTEEEAAAAGWVPAKR